MTSNPLTAILEVVANLKNELDTLKGRMDEDHREELERIENFHKEHQKRNEKRRQLLIKRRRIDFNFALSIDEGNIKLELENTQAGLTDEI